MFCSQCGTKAPDVTAKFCHNCGATLPQIVSEAAPEEPLDIQVPIDDFKAAPARSYGQVPEQDTPPPEPVQPPAYAPQQSFTQSTTMPPPLSDSDDDDEDDRPFWQKPAFIIIGAGLFFAFLAWGLKDFWSSPKKPEPQSMAPSTTGEPPVIDESETQTYYAVRKLKVRSKPSTDASILTELARGAQIEGTLVNGPDGQSRWIKVKGKDQYIAEVNLSDIAPEAMQTALNRVLTLDEQTEIRNRPADNGTTVDTLAAGGKVEALGIVNGWVEIALKKGGVGYIRPSDASINAIATLATGTAKPAVTAASAVDFGSMIAFNAESCSFGSGIDGVMAALSSNQGSGPFAVPGVEGELTGTADNPANPPAGKIRAAVKGNYKGLTLTGIYSSYEGNGITFADSPEKVAAAFSEAGFQKDENGGYVTSQDGGGGYIVSEGGRTVLSCGG
jgi:zinc-ribbon domain